MHSLLYQFATRCVKERIIDPQELEWLIYGLERRVTTIITSILFLLIGIYLANLRSVFAFIISFYFLMVRTNGYHANSFATCLCFSIIQEIIFLKLILPILSTTLLILLNFFGFIIIFRFAPFASHNMHLDAEEFTICKRSSRIRISTLCTVSIILYVFGSVDASRGITLGITLTALLLIIAYIKEKYIPGFVKKG